MPEITLTFAVDAENALEENRVEDAIELASAGVDAFPLYRSAYGILARAYLQAGNPDKAEEIARQGLIKFPLAKLFDKILKQIDEFKSRKDSEEPIEENDKGEILTSVDLPDSTKESDHLEFSKKQLISKAELFDKPLDPDDISAKNIRLLPGLAGFIFENPSNLELGRTITPLSAEPEYPIFEALAPIEEAEIPKPVIPTKEPEPIEKTKPEPPKSNENEEEAEIKAPKIVTDTMAEILVMQGAYKMAITAYTTLLSRHPDKRKFYLNKIQNVEKKILEERKKKKKIR